MASIHHAIMLFMPAGRSSARLCRPPPASIHDGLVPGHGAQGDGLVRWRV
jgi:hypothetical protein